MFEQVSPGLHPRVVIRAERGGENLALDPARPVPRGLVGYPAAFGI